jgi:metal-responsive CopG/Arc/MetJ family transcriptional regulator
MTKKVRPVEHAERFNMRASKELFEMLDNWRRKQPDIPGRSEAIRRLIEKGIAAEAAETAKSKRGK